VLPGGGSAAALVMSPDGHAASATATLVSSVSDPHHMSGSGVGSATATVPSTNLLGLAQATSLPQFNIAFLLDAPHAFSFSGLFTGTDSINRPQIFSSRTWGASLFFHLLYE